MVKFIKNVSKSTQKIFGADSYCKLDRFKTTKNIYSAKNSLAYKKEWAKFTYQKVL